MLAALRASPKQRDRTVRSLGLAYRDGLLGTGTFELRIDAALRVRTARQLRLLLADVPGVTRLRLAVEDILHRVAARDLPTAAAVNLVLPHDDADPRLCVGRHAHCDVIFTDSTVSRHHASLRREQGCWVVHDLGSSNGTWLNGQRVTCHVVVRGDELAFGSLVTRIV